MVPSKFLVGDGGGGGGGGGETEVLKSSPPKFFNSFLSILVLQCHFFVHLQSSTVGNTGIDTAGLVHVLLFVEWEGDIL